MAEDWDLHAVVRGCRASSTIPTPNITTTTHVGGGGGYSVSCLPTMGLQETEQMFGFPDLFGMKTSTMEEFEQLYKPFLPQMQNPISPLVDLGCPNYVSPPLMMKEPQKNKKSAPKKRRNQVKKVVHEVPAEAVCADLWAWRKYGQKPIKGSPYPRGYYRCSSSKGCSARKQVERSHKNPQMFIISYTGEHTHPIPAQRSSLAGTTRTKPLTPKPLTPQTPATITMSSSASSPMGLSPSPILTEGEGQSKQQGGEGGQDDLGMSMIEELLSNDFFMQFDEFLGPNFPAAPAPAPAPVPSEDLFGPVSNWFNTTSAAAAGGN